MTPEKQRITIAEACGWTDCREVSITRADRTEAVLGLWGVAPVPCATQPWLPDYLTDLNAMHEAEKVLSVAYRARYWWKLVDVAQSTHAFQTLHATAAQRAEAFLRTLGKWEDKG